MVEILREFFDKLGVDWVLWLLLALSVVSLGIVIERWVFFAKNASSYKLIESVLSKLLDAKLPDEEGLARIRAMRGMEASVISEALAQRRHGPAAVEEVVASVIARERVKHDRYLAFLGTLGNNAPFIGLFGTVLGIISAFQDLEASLAQGDETRNEAIMGSISEALVATAVGLLVAIPAVIAFNYFKGLIKTRATNAESLARLLLARLRSE
ncbi:MAG: MotA/TolQ/ExbB proton channel family protein [Myxococcales bacterium]|nr:MotA/TolQ/ExbB proton channel family protein [Myxococcales bacterium]